MKIKFLLYGFLSFLINLFFKADSKRWIFGADKGLSYREGSKYMMEYMLGHHPDYHCVFITSSTDVFEELKKKGIPCQLNMSLKGLIEISRAGSVFMTQTMADIMFVHVKRNRHFYYLVHGQPLKKAIMSLSDDYKSKIFKKKNILNKIYMYFKVPCSFKNVDFVSATSEYLKPFMEKDFGGEIPVKILGMPRNDAFFQKERFKNEKWITNADGKFVITYMPTHRKYGKGELSPILFEKRPEIQHWLKENNILILIKQHPNMIPKITAHKDCESIMDITKLGIDPQVCLFYSDVLISDYSSVWIDYLLLKRPIIFYYYDDFEHADAGVHYDIRLDPPGHFCYNEDELFMTIKDIKANYKMMCPSEIIISKYHRYEDGGACERYFNNII